MYCTFANFLSACPSTRYNKLVKEGRTIVWFLSSQKTMIMTITIDLTIADSICSACDDSVVLVLQN